MLAQKSIRAWQAIARAWPCLGLCCALVAGGCANCQLPRIDPSGERLFLPCNAPPQAPGALPAAVVAPGVIGQWGISVSPSQVIAPVGSEVVMIASVTGSEGYLLTRERVEWMLAPDSAGEFLSAGQRRPLDVFDWWYGFPMKINTRFAVNTTLTAPMTLDRGTPTPADDMLVQSGQAWVSVTSPTEGTSRVTVFAPDMYGWDRRQQTATIYWIDAQWRFPPPAMAPVGGRRTLSTMLTRQTDNSPLAGWQVRYEITGGPLAGFEPDGANSVEVLTNSAGEAIAEIVQKQPAPGTNQISMQVIRPAGLAGQNRPLPVGSGSTLQTWTSTEPAVRTEAAPPPAAAPMPAATPPPAVNAPPAAARLEVTVTGPTTGEVGSDVSFEIQVVNRGDGPATGIVVNDRFDAGLQHAASASPMEHSLANLQPGASASLDVTFRVMQAGQWCQDITVTADGGLRGTTRNCIAASAPLESAQPAAQPAEAQPSTTPPPGGLAQLSVRKSGPDRRRVGEKALFTIEVTNGSDQPIENLEVADHFETSLEPGRATEGSVWLQGNALGWKIPTLAAGKTIRREIEFGCLRETPRSCNRVTVTAPGIELAADEACLEIAGTAGAESAPAASSSGEPGGIGVTVADTADPIKVDGETTYQIVLTNKGSQSVFDVAMTVTFGGELRLENISGPLHASVLPDKVRFDPIREFRAGENPLSFELRFKGVRPAAARLRVEVISRGQAKGISAEQKTEILP